MLGTLINCNSFKFPSTNTIIKDFGDIHKVILDIISLNIDSLVKTVKYCAINKRDPKSMLCYVVKYL